MTLVCTSAAVGICSRWAMAPSNASSLVVRRTTGRDFAAAMCDMALTLSKSERWLIITPCSKNQCSQRVAQTMAVALSTRAPLESQSSQKCTE
eukprot:scaffold121392_cov75-Phaeocystis_antarctica.AAC.1